jgi:hypothetical protein
MADEKTGLLSPLTAHDTLPPDALYHDFRAATITTKLLFTV